MLVSDTFCKNFNFCRTKCHKGEDAALVLRAFCSTLTSSEEQILRFSSADAREVGTFSGSLSCLWANNKDTKWYLQKFLLQDKALHSIFPNIENVVTLEWRRLGTLHCARILHTRTVQRTQLQKLKLHKQR